MENLFLSQSNLVAILSWAPTTHCLFANCSRITPNGATLPLLMLRYPHMSSSEPATSVFVSTSRDHPLHMWDAFTGNLRATYRAYDHLDEVVAANSVCFNTAGDKIFAGAGKSV